MRDYQFGICKHLTVLPRHGDQLQTEWQPVRAPSSRKTRVKAMNKYNRLRGKAYQRAQPEGRSLHDIWYGNDSAALTIFRNFDNAMVTKFVGKPDRP